MVEMGMLGLLGICTWEDIKRKRIHLVVILLFAILGVICHLYYQKVSLQDMAGGMAVGLVLLCISLLSEERIGKGDALLVLATGIYLGFWKNLMVLWGGMVLAGVSACFLMFVRKKKKSYRIPFAPFLMLSYLICLVMGGIG